MNKLASICIISIISFSNAFGSNKQLLKPISLISHPLIILSHGSNIKNQNKQIATPLPNFQKINPECIFQNQRKQKSPFFLKKSQKIIELESELKKTKIELGISPENEDANNASPLPQMNIAIPRQETICKIKPISSVVLSQILKRVDTPAIQNKIAPPNKNIKTKFDAVDFTIKPLKEESSIDSIDKIINKSTEDLYQK